MRFHVVVHPTTKLSTTEVVQMELRDFLGNKPGDGRAVISWHRSNDPKNQTEAWRLLGVKSSLEVSGLLLTSEVGGAAKLLRAVDALECKLDDPDHLLTHLQTKLESMLAVFDPRIGRYTSVNGLRREDSTLWDAVLRDGKPVKRPGTDEDMTVDAPDEAKAKATISRLLVEASEEHEDAAMAALNGWMLGKRQVKRRGSEGRPTPTSPWALCTRKVQAEREERAKNDGRTKDEAKRQEAAKANPPTQSAKPTGGKR